MISERAALWLSAAAALTVGCAGLGFSVVTGSQAILLDGAFNLTYFVTALLTIKVSRLVVQPDTEDFPFGYSFFEPLINGFKGVLILGISMLALFDAATALFSGGRSIVIGPAIGYGVFATLACGATAMLLHRAHRSTRSPLVGVDAENWMLDGIISGAVLLAFCAVPAVEAMGWSRAVPYVDPLLVTAVVLISLGIPVRMAWRAVVELLNRAPPPEERAPIVATVKEVLADLPASAVYVRMIRPGRTLYVVAHVVVPDDLSIDSVSTLDGVRRRVDTALRRTHTNVFVDVVFTADPYWAAPRSSTPNTTPH